MMTTIETLLTGLDVYEHSERWRNFVKAKEKALPNALFGMFLDFLAQEGPGATPDDFSIDLVELASRLDKQGAGELDAVDYLDGPVPPGAWEALADGAENLGFKLELGETELNGFHGATTWFDGKPWTVTIMTNNRPKLHQFRTLAHELGHMLLHDPTNEKKGDEEDRSRREVEAEAVAWLTLMALGLDASPYSYGYILLSGEEKSGHYITNGADRITAAVRTILSFVDEREAVAA